MFTTVPVIIYGFIQYSGLDSLTWASSSPSPVFSTLGRSNFLGAYLAMTLPFTLAMIFKPNKKSFWMKGLLLLIMQIICLCLTLARAAWLGAVIGACLFFCLLWLKMRKYLFLGLVGLPIILGIFIFNANIQYFILTMSPGNNWDPNIEFQTTREESIKMRIPIWKNSLELIQGHVLLGHGPDLYQMVMLEAHPEGLQTQLSTFFVDDPHNFFLEEFVSVGLIGLSILFVILCLSYRNLFNAFQNGEDNAISTYSAAAISSLTAFLIHSQFSPDVITLTAFFWLIISLSFVLKVKFSGSGSQKSKLMVLLDI